MENSERSFDDDSPDIRTITENVDSICNITDALENFRQQWKNEVATKYSTCAKNEDMRVCPEEKKQSSQTKTEEAKRLFQQGVDNERNGQMHNAIKSYRMAMQLDPDVERHMNDALEFDEPTSDDEHDDINCSSDKLISKFSQLYLASAADRLRKCENTTIGILQLPAEILSLIFRWVAASHMDMKSVEALSEACRRFYLHARDDGLWRSACERVWGMHETRKSYTSWRNMFIERPHVHLDGVYISKVTYFRQGDPTVFFPMYQPFQCVEYYRYLRFFENHKMIFYMSHEEPSVVVPKLHFENTTTFGFRVGSYKLHSENQKKFKTVTITGVLTDKKDEKQTRRSWKRATRSEKKYILTETEYHLELELTSTSSKKRFNKCSWLNYSCRYKYADSVLSPLNEISLRDQYPPFYYSTVKSYNRHSFAPL